MRLITGAEVVVYDHLVGEAVVAPIPPNAAASYVPVVRTGRLAMTSGQLPLSDGELVATGMLGSQVSIPEAQEAAKVCAINVLSQMRTAIGDLEKIVRLVKITVFVASAPGFDQQHIVANGASEFLAAALGEKGAHARSAVGVAGLPLNAAVEVEAIFEIA